MTATSLRRELNRVESFEFVAHPLANMFPMIEGQAFEDLKGDIARQGVLVKITLFEGKILDGRNRYKAGIEIGFKFGAENFTQFDGTSEEAELWVISTNLHRRQLTAKQKQEMVIERIRKSPHMSARQIAKLLGVSHTMVADQKERLQNPPDLKEFKKFKETWEGLSDKYRQAFVKEFNIDIVDIQRLVVEPCSAANPEGYVVS